MRVAFFRFGSVLGTLLLLACSGKSKEAGPSSAAHAFLPVESAQPTESGKWVVDPDDPLTLYALGDRSLRSRDGGRTWAELHWPAGATSLAIARGKAPALYLRTSSTDGRGSDDWFVSQDGGDHWTKQDAMTVSSDPVVVEQRSASVLLAEQDDHLVRSDDQGATWSAPSLPTASLNLGPILVSGGKRPVVYVQSIGLDLETQLLVSTDAGATFVAKALPSEIAAAPSSSGGQAVSLDCHGWLYVLGGNTVYRSKDAGTSWESQLELDAQAFNFHVLQGAPSACGDAVYASSEVAGASALWKLEGGSVTRRDLPGGGELADLGSDRFLLVRTFGPRQRSDDGGVTWWTAGVDLGAGELIVSPTDAGSLFVSTVGGLYHSDDAGATWQLASSTHPVPQDVYPDPHDENVLYARSVFGEDSPWSFVSKDRGASFQVWPVPSADHPEMPEAVGSTAPDELTVFTQSGAYATSDAGAHFTPLFNVQRPKQVMWAAVGRSEPPALYAYVGGDDSAAPEVVASLDGGATWTSSDPHTYVTSLVVDPADPQVVVALPGVIGEEGGIVRTLNGGREWERVAVERDGIVSLSFDPQPPHALYAAGQRLQRSEDHGDSWQDVADLPPNARAFALDPNPGKARYVLSQRGLLYKMIE